MNTEDLIGPKKLFRTQRDLADFLGITQGAVSHWKGEIPALQQYRLREKLGRRLKRWLK